MMVLPSILAFEDESTAYFDDYYVDVGVSSVSGQMCTTVPISSAPSQKESVAIVHFKARPFSL